ncbi:MAG: aldo/keto reductase [Thiolinea sp.]
MHTRPLGPFQVSALGLGCMSFSHGYGSADENESARILHAALDAGYTFLDTATMYGGGHNESLIGKTLKARRQEYVLASKCGLYRGEDGKPTVNGRPEVLKQQCEASLRRLQTDVIDLYYLHRMDANVPIEESVGALADMQRAGKIQGIGLSEVSTASLRRAHAEAPIMAVQSEYSLWSRTPEISMLDACTELGVTFVPFSPLARAFLTGKAVDNSQLPADDIRSTNARPRFEPDNFARNSELLKPYAAVAERVGCSMAQLALAWLLSLTTAGKHTLIPHPSTKHMDFMLENAGAGDLLLDDATLSELNELINEDKVVGTRYTAALMQSTDRTGSAGLTGKGSAGRSAPADQHHPNRRGSFCALSSAPARSLLLTSTTVVVVIHLDFNSHPALTSMSTPSIAQGIFASS